jgi:GT2 family glycosyltransferase
LRAPPKLTIIYDGRGSRVKQVIRAIKSATSQQYLDLNMLVVFNGCDDEISNLRTKGVILADSLSTLSKKIENSCDEWYLLLGRFDLLTENSLLHFSHACTSSTNIHLWYGDSDIEKNETRSSPKFKSNWNKQLFYSVNYIGNTICINRHLVSTLLRKGILFESDAIFLYLIENQMEYKIGHIPEIVSSERFIEDRIAVEARAKTRRQRVKDHFAKIGVKSSVDFLNRYGGLRVSYHLENPAPSVSIVIPTRDQADITRNCIESIIEKTEYGQYEIVLVDNASKTPEAKSYFSKIRDNANVKVIEYPGAFNFSAINNFAVSGLNSDIFVFLNNDIEVISEAWLKEMVSYASQKNVGCVGARLIYENRNVQHAGVICGVGNVAAHAHRHVKSTEPGYCGRLQYAQEYSAVTGACLAIRSNVFFEVGSFDENNLPVAYNDVDLCLRTLKSGYKNIYTPHAVLYHYESLSRGSENTKEKRERYVGERNFMWKTWKNYLENDPYYNPNLSRFTEDFSRRF